MKGRGRFKGVVYPVWFRKDEIMVAQKILEDNPGLTPYSAILATSSLCNKDSLAASKLLKEEAIVVDVKAIPRHA